MDGLGRLLAVVVVFLSIGGLALAASALPTVTTESPASDALERPAAEGLGGAGAGAVPAGGGAESGAAGGAVSESIDGSSPSAGPGGGSGLGGSSGAIGGDRAAAAAESMSENGAVGTALFGLAALFLSLGGSSGGAPSDLADAGQQPSDGVDPQDLEGADRQDLEEVDGSDLENANADADATDGTGTDALEGTAPEMDGESTGATDGAPTGAAGDVPTGGDAPSAGGDGGSFGGLFDVPASLGGFDGVLGGWLSGDSPAGSLDGADAAAGGDSPGVPAADSEPATGGSGGGGDTPSFASDASLDGGSGGSDSGASGSADGSSASDGDGDDSGLEESLSGGASSGIALAAVLAALALGYVLYRSDDPVGTLLSIPRRLVSLAVGLLVGLSTLLERAVAALARVGSIAELPGLALAALLGALATVRVRASETAASLPGFGSGGESSTTADDAAASETTARERIRESWDAVVASSSVYRRRVATPAEVARSAATAGAPREPVETITEAFRDVEYGERDPESRVEAAETAGERLRAAMDAREEDEE